MTGLRLEVREIKDLTRWRWVLTDSSGVFIADHEVRLDDRCWQYEAFNNLLGYLSWHVTPDRYASDEARIVGELGAWIGEQMLGPVGAALASAAPATVRVVLPKDAAWLAFRPLELAHANDRPLAVQDVTLVMDTGITTAPKTPTRDRLRVLGLFSLPEGGQPLNLRRERYELVRLIERIAAGGKAADVRVLQYGVTRDRLRDVLEEAEGWDIIHISGHGAPGALQLETPAGAPDRVTAAELAELIHLARERVTLVTVSVCWSAALTAAEERRLLGLPHSASSTERTRSSPPAEADSGTLATTLTARLNCAVLAMRYPVTDDFAIALSARLYELLAAKGQPLPRAVGLTLRELADSASALSIATPALFGAQAVNLTLAAPKRVGTRSYATSDLKMAGFPPEPDRFVGRVAVMTRASAALAAESGIPGVLLHGMPGGGKTACALELAYGHEHAFEQLIWYKAPDEDMDITGALTDFTLTLERYLNGFQMAHLLTSSDNLAGFLPLLTELMERFRLLIVIDNAESLLTGDGNWRDDRWGHVFIALTAHAGLGRVIMTSRRVPSSLPRLHVEAVDALSADEALLLARELPHLRALIYQKLPGLDGEVSRQLALGVLNVAQGHPKLLELANGQAARPDQLAKLVEAGDQAWREQGGLPEGFFATGETTRPVDGTLVTAADYWPLLATWTKSVVDTLTPGERDLFWFLCCLEELDRDRVVMETIWPRLWADLTRDGQPPDVDQALAAIAACGLASARHLLGSADASSPAHAATTSIGAPFIHKAPHTTDAADFAPPLAADMYVLHPGVAEAGRGHAGKPFREAVDTEAAMFWDAVYEQASGRLGQGTVDSRLAGRAGLAAVPYLARLQEWAHLAYLLEGAFKSKPSRASAAAMLPAIQQATRHDPARTATMALVLEVIDPSAAETVLRDHMDVVIASGDYRVASTIAGRLADLCLNTGRLAEALDLADRQVEYTRQAGLGPWCQLSDELQRLHVLTEMGMASHVLEEVSRLRDRMDTLPTIATSKDPISPWAVRETLFAVGGYAAHRLGRWAEALGFNDAILTCLRTRNASAWAITKTRFNNYGFLLRLGRTDEALAVLQDCLSASRDVQDVEMIGKTLTALAEIEEQRGHGESALRLIRDALRHAYLAGSVGAIAMNYHNHGTFLHRLAREPTLALANHLASALICVIIGADNDDESINAAAIDLREFGTSAIPPTDVADLCRQVGDVLGTNLPGLLAALSPDPGTAEQALCDLIARVREVAGTSLPQVSEDPD